MRIGVWNTAFLGDAVLTLPLVQSLKLRYPQAAIDLYVRGGLAGLFNHHPDISDVYSYDKRGKEKGLTGALKLWREVASRGYDIWISAHTSARSAAFAIASRAGIRIGYDKPAFNRVAYTHKVDRCFGRLDEIERLLRLLGPLGDGPMDDWPRITLGNDVHNSSKSFFAGIPGPVLGMHPGSVWGTKRWPVRYYGEIGRKALLTGASVILFAGPGEEDIAREVKATILDGLPVEFHDRLFDLSGSLSLPELAAYISCLSCYLTNDSGPMHIAWAQHVPTTALFGPTVRSLGFFPRGPASTVFEVDLECRPCGLHGPVTCPKGHHNCMEHILPNTVWDDVRAKLWPMHPEKSE